MESPEPLQGVVEALLEPGDVTPEAVRRALLRARRYGVYWRALTPLERALLRPRSSSLPLGVWASILAMSLARTDLTFSPLNLLILSLEAASRRALSRGVSALQ